MRDFAIILVALLLGIVVIGCKADGDHKDSGGGDAGTVIGCEDDDSTSDSTWTDSSTGLTWQVKPYCKVVDKTYPDYYCGVLDLDGGGWMVPSISELRSLIRGCDATQTGGSCEVTDDHPDGWAYPECFGCDGQGPASNGAFWPDELSGLDACYWSSTKDSDLHLTVCFFDAAIRGAVNFEWLIRCVRY